MTREEYEEIANAYEQAYLDYSKMMRKTIPESWRIEAAMKDLEELRLLMKQYEDEHPEECRISARDTEREQPVLADEDFLKELEAMDGPDEVLNPPPSIPDLAVVNAQRRATVSYYRAKKDSSVVVKMIATVEAATEEEAIEKAMVEIKGVFPVDTLWPEDVPGWYWDDEDGPEVEWMNG